MKRHRRHVKYKKNIISLSSVLYFVAFIAIFISIIKTGRIDNIEFNELIKSSDGFESVLTGIIMLVLKVKK
jgi:hypothetical protein